MRLDRFISSQLPDVSRKEVKKLCLKGRLTVNGKRAARSDMHIDEHSDSVALDGTEIIYREHIYIMLNKPQGVVCATRDGLSKTVLELIPPELRRRGLFPAGRLDKDTTGLLIITDDGDFAHRVLSPQKNIFKTYIAELDGDITEETLDIFSREITLADGTVCRRAYLKKLDTRTAEIKICEGRYHQIKRMLGVAGLGVNSLERRAIGGYFLPDYLKEGECIEVPLSELDSIFNLKTV